MRSLFHLKPQAFIGLDIHADEISLLELQIHKNQQTLHQLAIEPLPKDAIREGKIKDPDKVGTILEALVKSTRTSGRKAAIALPAQNVISKRIKLAPHLTPQEREFELLSNAEYYLPGISESLCCDFVSLPNDEALLIAARQDQLRSYADLADKAGLQVTIVDIDTYALGRALKNASSQQELIILDIRLQTAQLIVFHKQEMIFIQSLEIASLKSELKSLFPFLRSSHRQIQWDFIKLTGNANYFSEMKDFLEKDFNFRVEISDPFAKIKISEGVDRSLLNSKASSLTLSYGLALRGVQHA